MKVNILGTSYQIFEKTEGEDTILKNCDGYCDKTSKKIVIVAKPSDCDLDDWNVYKKKILRHEIIHAFLYESGLHENFEHKQYGHDETFIDWIAVQFPKILKIFIQIDCI